jgi:flagellar biosynthetic protein FlhB
MAGDQDQAERTEEPTQRRLDEARAKGRLVSSRELNSLFLIVTAALLWALAAGEVGRQLFVALRGLLLVAGDPRADDAGLARLIGGPLRAALAALALPALGFVLAAMAPAVVQGAVVWSAEGLRPKPERLSPLAGARRLLGPAALADLAKSLVKLALVAAAAAVVLSPERARLVDAAGLGPAALLALLHDDAGRLLLGVAVALAPVAVLDWLHQRRRFMGEMRMSRRDLQEEHKQTEGDPVIRQRLRTLRMSRARRRMMAEVPKATVVVTNPTHVAVALRYDALAAAAPTVVAKGRDLVARRIRETATAHGVPIVENPPLARSLHKAVEVGQTIPEAHYQAVAQIIGHILRLRRAR